MTVEEIKQQTTMQEVLSRYGIKTNRSEMCSCPFHGKDRHPSMKIYKDGYKCFTCGKYGDIFGFVQEYENCSFRDAFLILGGTYESMTEQRKVRTNKKFERIRTEKQLQEKMQTDFQSELLHSIKMLEDIQTASIPLCESWCYAVNNLPFLMCAWEEKYIEGKEVNEIDVHRKCREVRSRFNY